MDERRLRVACVGGGPGGLFFATLLRQARPRAEVTVFERNRPDDTFGFGVVFSDAALGAIHEADPVLLRGLRDYGAHWSDIEVRLHGERVRCGGHGMAAIARRTLLALLRERAVECGVTLRFEHEVRDIEDTAVLDGYDLVVAADGANSLLRTRFAAHFQPVVDVAVAKFIWLGTEYLFEGLTFVHQGNADGVFAVHGYPYGPDGSTFIVETDEASWRRAGLDGFDVTQPPGPSDLTSKAYLEELFAEQIDGHPLLVNNSRWGNFRTLRARSWRHRNLVLLGDAAHTAHFSVGSGTKMAMEDAVGLAGALSEHLGLDDALAAYEAQRRPDVERIQGSARPSLSWWENFGRYHDSFEPLQFVFHFLSRAISRDKLERRDPGFVRRVEDRWVRGHREVPLESPLVAGDARFDRRVLRVRGGRGARARGVRTAAGWDLPLVPGGAAPPHGRPWGLWLEAPDAEKDLPAAVSQLEAGVNAGAALVAVGGPNPLTRVLLCEEARLVRKTPALYVGADINRDRALTLLLSGRADLVAREGPDEEPDEEFRQESRQEKESHHA